MKIAVITGASSGLGKEYAFATANSRREIDEIWLIAKYYSKQQDGKYYKGFIVREIITEQEIQQASESVFDDLPF